MASKHRYVNNHHNSAYDLRHDMKLIKKVLAGTTKDMKGKAKEVFYNSLDDVKAKSANVQDVLTNHLIEKPFKSLGIALLAGFVLGCIMRK